MLRSNETSRNVVNSDEVIDELNRRQIPFHIMELSGLTLRQQVNYASENCSLILAAHGQALWITHFLPEQPQ